LKVAWFLNPTLSSNVVEAFAAYNNVAVCDFVGCKIKGLHTLVVVN